MDHFREKYKSAQSLADKVLLMKKGQYFDFVASPNMCIDSQAYVPTIAQWYQLHGFRINTDQNSTSENLHNAVKEWVRSTNGVGCDAAYVLLRDNSTVSVLYGTGRSGLEGLFQSNISECSVYQTEWKDKTYCFNGIFTGTFKSSGLSDAFVASGLKNCYIACVFTPVADSEILKIVEGNRRQIGALNEYKSFRRVYGNASKRTEEVPLHNVVQAIALLKEENEYLEHNMGGGFVRAAVKFGADSADTYRALASLIQSSIDYNIGDQKGYEPSRNFRIDSRCHTMRECLAIPYIYVSNVHFSGAVHTLTMQDVKSVSSFCVPPTISCEGYYVKNYNINEESLDIFPLIEQIKMSGINIGRIINSSYKAVIPFSNLCAHMFVAGASGSGKSTTVKKVLTELYSNGIPFTVIEAAKKEYISLLGTIPELKVYTPGNDGMKLSFNPLQPEDGVLIENHVAAVVKALLSATGGEHPIPEAYSGLLKQSYSQFGWEFGMMAYTDEYKPFPTFKDVFDNVDSYIANHAKYGPEVRQNLTAALALRTETMHSGALGGLFSQPRGLRAADLLESPCVIELSDFSTESAAFIMNILLYKFQCYLSKHQECAELKRVVVVEEAHNIFKKTLAEDSGRALNNDYFDKMLSEIRSSGTGLILSDQRPSIMSDAVMANTSVKILHALTDWTDREIIGAATNMSELQIKRLSEFEAGECVISLRGIHGVQHTMVEASKTTSDYNVSCHVCASRFRCRRMAVRKMMESMNPSLIKYHITKIQANPYNLALLETNITSMLKDLNVTASSSTKVCFLGEVINKYGTDSVQEGRIIVNSYSEYLRRRGN